MSMIMRRFSFTTATSILPLLLPILLSLPSPLCQAQQRSDPTQFNGGSILAMAGRDCVAIAIDSRFGLGLQTISTGGNDSSNSMTISKDEEDVNSDDIGNSNNNGGGGEGNPRIIHLPNSNTLLAWTGLYGDGLGFATEMNTLLAGKLRRAGSMGFQHTQHGGRKMMSPRAITSLMSHLLYRRRNAPYYVEPVVVGLERVCVPIEGEEELNKNYGGDIMSSGGLKAIIEGTSMNENPMQLIQSSSQNEKQSMIAIKRTNQKLPLKYKTIQRPYLCGTDMLGAQSSSQSFICSGVASRTLHGTAEALWKPNLDGEELVKVCGQAFVSALERDILSGYGAVVYLIQAVDRGDGDGGGDDVQIVEYVLACRND